MQTAKFTTIRGFSSTSLHCRREPHSLHYLKQKTSFWIAVISLFAFVAGNMVGQHGWYTFWASVLGEGDDSLIAYTGTVTPLAEIVDYTCWAKFGGDFKSHTFRQSPVECRTAAPAYEGHANHPMISMEYMSGYTSGEEGTGLHSGVDYRVPVGTPVRTVMAGRVTKVVQDSPGYGMFIVLKHPGSPDPDNPGSVTTLYSTYAHLSATYVMEGEVLQKGDEIGLSGNSGESTGPHLHIQIDRGDAPFIPYSPGTVDDGYRYTLSPMLYVQANLRPIATTTVVRAGSSSSSVLSRVISPAPQRRSVSDMVALLRSRREDRIRSRSLAVSTRQTVATARTEQPLLPSAPPVVVEPKVDTVLGESVSYTAENGTVDTLRFVHDGSFTGRGWEKLRVTLLDADGNPVANPRLDSDLRLVAAYGTAEFRPATLSVLDFAGGTAEVFLLPRGRRTVVIQAIPFSSVSEPLRYEE